MAPKKLETWWRSRHGLGVAQEDGSWEHWTCQCHSFKCPYCISIILLGSLLQLDQSVSTWFTFGSTTAIHRCMIVAGSRYAWTSGNRLWGSTSHISQGNPTALSENVALRHGAVHWQLPPFHSTAPQPCCADVFFDVSPVMSGLISWQLLHVCMLLRVQVKREVDRWLSCCWVRYDAPDAGYLALKPLCSSQSGSFLKHISYIIIIIYVVCIYTVYTYMCVCMRNYMWLSHIESCSIIESMAVSTTNLYAG